VTRNRVRRRMREAVGSLCIAPGWDIVFNSRVKVAGASFAQIRGAMQTLLERAEVLEEPVS